MAKNLNFYDFQGYLGSVDAGKAYDACELLGSYQGPKIPVLVDQGTADNFLKVQLKTEDLVNAAGNAKYPMTVRMQPGYDHSYYFISSFMRDHIQFHARALGLTAL